MLTYAQIKGDRKSFLALTGLTHTEFKYLLPAFQRAYEQLYPTDKRLDGMPRQRQVGGGRKGALHAWEQKLLFVLVYVKAYPLQVLHGITFDLSQSQTNYWLHHLLPVLKRALDNVGVMPDVIRSSLHARNAVAMNRRNSSSMGLNAAASGPKVLKNRRCITVVKRRRTATRMS